MIKGKSPPNFWLEEPDESPRWMIEAKGIGGFPPNSVFKQVACVTWISTYFLECFIVSRITYVLNLLCPQGTHILTKNGLEEVGVRAHQVDENSHFAGLITNCTRDRLAKTGFAKDRMIT